MLKQLDTKKILISNNEQGVIVSMSDFNIHLGHEESEELMAYLFKIKGIRQILGTINSEPELIRELREDGFEFGDAIDDDWEPRYRNPI